MRIRTFRWGDLPTLAHIQELAARADGVQAKTKEAFEQEFALPEVDATSNVFLITDDDDELNEWGQGETLEGVEGETVGYTMLRLYQDRLGYHFVCEGAVHPDHRGRGAGWALLICALNCAITWSTEFVFEAMEAGQPIFFEALLPDNSAASARLAARCEMEAVDEQRADGMVRYQRELL
jgi:GNAT superfamily N-acetyltransferase